VIVKVRTGEVLTLTSVTITPSAGGPAVATQIVSQTNNPQPAFMRSESAYVLPLTPLQPGTTYTVQLAGTSDAAAFTRTYSFTTAGN
jgi:hypothetical protein